MQFSVSMKPRLRDVALAAGQLAAPAASALPLTTHVSSLDEALANRGIKRDGEHEHDDTFRRELPPDLGTDDVVASPLFNG